MFSHGWYRYRQHGSLLTFIVFLLALFAIAPAQARPLVVTKTKYYNVNGRDAADLHRKMTVPGFLIGGHKAYANITANFDAAGKVVQRRNYCKLKSYRVKLKFTITLPRLVDGKKLSKSVRRQFKTFQSFSHRHELKHQEIWTSCAAKIEKKVKRVKVKNCSSFDRQAQKIIAREWNRCSILHDNFDRRERRRVRSQPLIKNAIRTARKKKSTRVLSRYKSIRTTNKIQLGSSNR